MIIVTKNTNNVLAIFKDVMEKLDPSYTDFVAKFTYDSDKKSKYVHTGLICLQEYYYLGFNEGTPEDLPNGKIDLKLMDHMLELFQSNGYTTDESLMKFVYREKIRVINV